MEDVMPLGFDPMSATMQPGIYSVAESAIRNIPIENFIVTDQRRASVDHDVLSRLEQSVQRQGLLVPIGAYKGEGVSWHLIWGLHRLITFEHNYALGEQLAKKTGDVSERDRWASIPCRCFLKPIPAELAKLFEIEENLARKDLGQKERAAQTLEAAALLQTEELVKLGLNRAARIHRVAEARQEGNSLRTIAEKEGVSLGQVQRDLQESSTVSGGGTVAPTDGKVKGRDGKTRTAKPKRQPKPAPERSAEADGEPEGSAELFDLAGQPVPSQAYDAFNQLPEIQKLVSLAEQLAREVDRVARLPVGRLFTQTADDIRAIKRRINGYKPAYVCPYCKGIDNCTCCHGTGWVSEHTWKQAPPQMKGEAK
jgi:hypothetical protein